jgi:undecaprenyl-diphosphatase
VARLTIDRLVLWDESLCLRCNRASHRPWARVVLQAASRLGDGVFWYALMGVLLSVHGRGALVPVLQMFVTWAIGVTLYKWLKKKVSRPRPHKIFQEITLSTAPLDQFSFPSGHTLHAVGFTTVALAHYPELAWLLVPFSMLVAASRPVLGLHYPSDVLAGAVLGAGVAASVLLLG